MSQATRRRFLSRLLRRRPMPDLLSPETVLLFYREPQRDRFFRGDHQVRRALRPLYNHVRRDQSVSGFYVWYLNLIKALRLCGYRVVLNNRRLARENPAHPVGLVGYPAILDGWDLPNPAILGPGMYDHPSLRPDLTQDPRVQLYILTCGWMLDLFVPAYGPTCVPWHAGIDLDQWKDTGGSVKSLDFLVYDKIRWRREHFVPSLLEPALEALRRRGLSFEVLRYGGYTQRVFRDLLQRSRGMLFLCEHETQGLAYQEALASNVPVLAWDNGYWLDPRRDRFEAAPVPASSVPYFSEACGERFHGPEDLEPALERFLSRRAGYRPRAYVARELSLRDSGQRYYELYSSLLNGHRQRPPMAVPVR